jgi:signal transduction histidine kinase
VSTTSTRPAPAEATATTAPDRSGVPTQTPSATNAAQIGRGLAVALPALVLVGVGVAEASSGGLGSDDVIRAVLAVAWAAAAGCLVASPQLSRLGRLVAVAASLGAAGFAADAVGQAHPGPAGHGARLLAAILPALVMGVGIHFLLAVPSGFLESTARRVGAALGYVAGAGVGVWALAGPGRLNETAALAGWAAVLAVGVPATARRYRAAPGIDRRRIQLLACGGVAAAEVGLVAGGLALLVSWPPQALAIAAAATALIPVGLIAGTFPTALDQADRILVRLVTVTGVSVAVLAVYLVVILGFGHRPSDEDRQVLGLALVAAAIVAVGASPTRRRVQEAAQHLVYGSEPVPDDVVATFRSRLTRAVTMDELLLQLVEALHRSMPLSHAEVFTGTAEVLERTVSLPDVGPMTLALGEAARPVVARVGVAGAAWTSVWLPELAAGREQFRVCHLTYGGELLGLVLVERPNNEPPFTEDEELVVTELCRQVGLALHNVRLDSALQSSLDEVRRQADELRASRARIVAAADAERRRVERDLHDGAQQHLVALAVNLRLARDQVADDPDGAASALDQLAADVKATVQELRDLAHGIYPPLLMDNGLPDALRAVAARSPLHVETELDGVGRYDAAVEAAVYFCCLEALQNAAKHAAGAEVTLRVWEEAGGLLFSVSDDGPGFDKSATESGHGFMNMSDRLGAIGGSIRWDSTVGEGSTVRGSVPLG